jgi:hypothetical protein
LEGVYKENPRAPGTAIPSGRSSRLWAVAILVIGGLVTGCGTQPPLNRSSRVPTSVVSAPPLVSYPQPPSTAGPSASPRAENQTGEVVEPVVQLPATTVLAEPLDALSPIGGDPVTTAAVDFGGKQLGNEASLFVEGGGAKQPSFWPAIVARALAGAAPPDKCSQELERQDLKLVVRKPIDTYNTAEFLPGLNHVPWGALVNGHFVVLSGVAVLRSHSISVDDPVIEIYPNWGNVRNKATATPKYALSTKVRTYEAAHGILYRLVVTAKDTPVSCLDMLIPYTGMKAIVGRIHYHRGVIEYIASFAPARLTP